MSSNVLRGIYALKGPKSVREWLGLSLTQAGELCGVSDGLYSNWQTGYRIIYGSAIQILGERIANKLTNEIGREIGVKIEINTRWHVTAWTRCKKCRTWFKMRRSRDRVCNDCRLEMTTPKA